MSSIIQDTSSTQLNLHDHDNDSIMKPSEAASPKVPVDVQSIQTNASTKAAEEFRTYSSDDTPERVLQHYKDMRMYQTVEFYDRMAEKYSFENGCYRYVCSSNLF